jgi:hypothetical protein
MGQKGHCHSGFIETFYHGKMERNDSELIFQTPASAGMKSLSVS